MSLEPKRLLLDDPGFARLVEASERDGPSNAQVDRALAQASRAAMPAARWGSRLLIGLGVIGIAAILAIRAGGDAPAVGAPLAPRVVATAIPSVPHETAPVETSGPPVMTISVDDLEAAPPDLSAQKARKKLADNIDAKRSTFEEEVALVGAARSALGAGDVPACMSAVERYHERFGAGTFAQEIEVIRIEALVLSGEQSKARAAGEKFLKANAGSPYAERVRSITDP